MVHTNPIYRDHSVALTQGNYLGSSLQEAIPTNGSRAAPAYCILNTVTAAITSTYLFNSIV